MRQVRHPLDVRQRPAAQVPHHAEHVFALQGRRQRSGRGRERVAYAGHSGCGDDPRGGWESAGIARLSAKLPEHALVAGAGRRGYNSCGAGSMIRSGRIIDSVSATSEAEAPMTRVATMGRDDRGNLVVTDSTSDF